MEKGLGTEGFWFASTLMLVVNADLIVIKEKRSFYFHGEAIRTVESDSIFLMDAYGLWKHLKNACKYRID